MIGPGKYDDLCTLVRKNANAAAAIVLIIDGKIGNGFACQGHPGILRELPDLLREVANQIEEDAKNEPSR
jgi:hypothetical protein